MAPLPSETRHATCISIDGEGVLIMGPSGSGKSALALELMAHGAKLVADDQTCLTMENDAVIATAPHQIEGLIEARGVGLLAADAAGATTIAFVVDLGQSEPDRLPHAHSHSVLGREFPCLWGSPASHFAAAILQYARGGLGLRP